MDTSLDMDTSLNVDTSRGECVTTLDLSSPADAEVAQLWAWASSVRGVVGGVWVCECGAGVRVRCRCASGVQACECGVGVRVRCRRASGVGM